MFAAAVMVMLAAGLLHERDQAATDVIAVLLFIGALHAFRHDLSHRR